MAQHRPPSPGSGESSHSDPWQAFSYLVAGVVVYGGIGWLIDRWLGTSWIVGLGIVVGAGLGIYLTIVRFSRPSGRGGDERDPRAS
jgi:ATP synthase protein I